MKRIMILLAALVWGFTATAQTSNKKPAMKSSAAVSKYSDNVDDRMKGPNGEKVYIGTQGGRYYLTPSGSKVYVKHKGTKNKKA
jgi:hypothetical protein